VTGYGIGQGELGRSCLCRCCRSDEWPKGVSGGRGCHCLESVGLSLVRMLVRNYSTIVEQLWS
jgi:hypothetical protein